MIEKTFEEFVKAEMKADPAHDLNHIRRVVKMAKAFAANELANIDVVMPAAWLHDCYAVPKNHPQRSQSSKLAADKAVTFLKSINYSVSHLDEIHHAIVAHSYSANVFPETIEAKVVQDADRIDAIGAIGVARCIQVNTSLGGALYCDTDPFCKNRAPDDSKYAIDHFYEKLFNIAGSMKTAAGVEEAKKRMSFMLSFLDQLALEV